jgi:hypothetical protein
MQFRVTWRGSELLEEKSSALILLYVVGLCIDNQTMMAPYITAKMTNTINPLNDSNDRTPGPSNCSQ